MPAKQKKASAKGKAAQNTLPSLSVNESPMAEIPGSQDAGGEGRYPEANEDQLESEQDIPVTGQ